MSRYRWTLADAMSLPGQNGVPGSQDERAGAQRVGGRYVQRGTAGRRPGLNNTYFRSRWEANAAAWLQWQTIVYEYEPKRFVFPGIKGRNYSYLPDFFLPAENRYLEVKGWLTPDDKVRLHRMARWFPEIRIEVIPKAFFQAICRQRMCRLIPAWECRHTGY